MYKQPHNLEQEYDNFGTKVLSVRLKFGVIAHNQES